MIMVAGCSWACGEWARRDLSPSKKINHGGLAQYVEESGIKVVNLGIAGAGNLVVVRQLQTWFERHPDHDITKVVVFQTDIERDSKMIYDEDYESITSINDVANRMLARYYRRLEEISLHRQVPILVVGGMSDTLDPALIARHYQGITVACQSMISLLLDDCDTIPVPVFSWYMSGSQHFIDRMKTHMPSDLIPDLLAVVDRGIQRENTVYASPDLFWPDGFHPNRHGHKKLYDHMVNYGQLP